MRVTINDQVYKIRFNHTTEMLPLHLSRKVSKELGIGAMTNKAKRALVMVPRRATVCKIVLADVDLPIATGWATCNPVDQFVKEVGRTKSLERCVSDLPDELKSYAIDFLAAYVGRKPSVS